MKKFNWFLILGLCFLGTAFMVYSFHYLIFGDSYFIFKYLIAQLGFLPINVFLVTVVINQLMSRREKRARMQKINMIIGAFFSDIGSELLAYLSLFDKNLNQNREYFIPDNSWSNQDFNRAKSRVEELDLHPDCQESSLVGLNSYLSGKRQQLLSFLENPNLMEHEYFTDLIWAVFHLQDELRMRSNLDTISKPDASHLSVDIKRAYLLLIIQWLDYMKHLQNSYPYLYSLAVRTNPFDTSAKVEVEVSKL